MCDDAEGGLQGMGGLYSSVSMDSAVESVVEGAGEPVVAEGVGASTKFCSCRSL